MTWGYNDNVCPPTTSYAAYNIITAPKKSRLTPMNKHWTPPETQRAQREWIEMNFVK